MPPTCSSPACFAADKAGQLEDDIYVLELGIGVGLFARYFFDRFRELCRQHKKDYHARLIKKSRSSATPAGR
jgi:hypothetical protein